MKPSIGQLLNPDQAAQARDAILTIGRDFVAACLDYRRTYPQTGSEELKKFVGGLDDVVEFLRPRLNKIAILPSLPSASSSSSEVGPSRVAADSDHKTAQSTIPTNLKLRVPARKRKRVEDEDDWESEDFRPKRVKSEPIIMPSVPLHETSAQLQPAPLERSYAFYETYYGGRLDVPRKVSRTASITPVASGSWPTTADQAGLSVLEKSDAELDALEVLIVMNTKSSSGDEALVPPPVTPHRAKSKGRKARQQTRPTLQVPSPRRSARLQKQPPKD